MSKTPLHDLALVEFPKQNWPLLLWQGLVKQIEEENTNLKTQAAAAKPSVWYGKMPESNGRNNWTAILYNADKSENFTLSRSEFPHRVRYAADCVRHIIGELAEAPFILDYDANERTPCHLCGGSGLKDGKSCWGLNFNGTAHTTPKVLK